MSYSGQELYPTLIEKVAALGFSLIKNHSFVDGNKRIGHAAIEVTLLMNDYEIQADVNTQEAIILAVAASEKRVLFGVVAKSCCKTIIVNWKKSPMLWVKS